MHIRKFARKAFYVEAVQVTVDNMAEVAEWCKGEIRTEDGVTFVKVKVHRPLNKKQSQAVVGDWVLLSNTGWKVYTDQALANSFEMVVDENSGDNVFEAVEVTDIPQELQVIGLPAPEYITTEDDEADKLLEELASDTRVDPREAKKI